MESVEDTIKKLEFLKIARQQLNNEYLQKIDEDFKQWTSSADIAWKSQGIKLPFNMPVMFPTETDVVSRALELFNKSTLAESVDDKIKEIFSTPIESAKVDEEDIEFNNANDIAEPTEVIDDDKDVTLELIAEDPIPVEVEEIEPVRTVTLTPPNNTTSNFVRNRNKHRRY